MKMRSAMSVVLLVPALLGPAIRPASAGVADEFQRMGLEIGTQILTDPADFLFDIYLNNEDRSPLPIDKSWQLGTNIFPTLLPFGAVGLDGKTRLHREHGGWPQWQIGWGGWYFVPSSAIPADSASASLLGWHLSTQVAISADPRFRIFGGYEITQMRMNVELDFSSDDPADAATGTELNFQNSFSSLHTGKTEHFLFMGAEALRSPTKRLIAEVGYGIVSSKLIARITWASKYFDNGISFYPEGAFSFWPFWNFQVRW